jgi:hypothetical protein
MLHLLYPLFMFLEVISKVVFGGVWTGAAHPNTPKTVVFEIASKYRLNARRAAKWARTVCETHDGW